MSKALQAFAALVTFLGAASLWSAAFEVGATSDPSALVAYAALSMLASAIKVRIPGLTGSVSLGFLAVLVGVAMMSRAETVIVVAISTVVQSWWPSSGGRPRPIQLIFNASLLAGSTWVAYVVAHAAAPQSPTLQVVAAVAPLYLLNAGAVAALLSLMSTGKLSAIWEKFQLAIFPCYLVGAVLAMLITQALVIRPDWTVSSPLLALVYLSFNSYRAWMRNVPACVS